MPIPNGGDERREQAGKSVLGHPLRRNGLKDVLEAAVEGIKQQLPEGAEDKVNIKLEVTRLKLRTGDGTEVSGRVVFTGLVSGCWAMVGQSRVIQTALALEMPAQLFTAFRRVWNFRQLSTRHRLIARMMS